MKRFFREEIREFLEGDGFTVLLSSKPSEAFSVLRENEVDILILDLRLPKWMD
jgi:DNA-binding response OmpR family regulator